MSEQAKRSSALTPFEAALAALAPRVEAFDRERLIFLAGQTAAMRDCGAGVSPAATSVGGKRAGGLSDVILAGGTPAPQWGWQAAFAVMTAVAATLLVMLCTRSAPTVATSEPKSAVASDNVSGTEHPLAGRVPPSVGTRSVPDTLDDAVPLESDAALRAELRRHGVDFGRPRVAAWVDSPTVAKGPMTYYELLRRLQEKGPAGQGGLEEMMQ